MKVPVLERSQALGVDVGSKALQDGLVRDLATLVDRNLNDFVSRRRGKLPGIDNWIRSRSGKRRADLVTVKLAAPQSSIGLSGLRTKAESGERLGLGAVLFFGAGDWSLRGWQLRHFRRNF